VTAAAVVVLAAVLAAGGPSATGPATRPAEVVDPRPVEQRFIYFPPHRFSQLREIRIDGALLLTNAERPGAEAIQAYLKKLTTELNALPLRRRPTTTTSRPASRPAPPPVVAALYARQDQFKSLWRRVGVYYKGRFFGVGAAGGYSYRVFCATYADERAPDEIPPELSHEFTHVWLWRRAGVPNNGSWLSEGLAMVIQMRMHGDAEARRDWARRVASGRYLPLKRLMTDTPVEHHRYWQACLLVELILADRPDALPAVIQAVRRGRTANHIVTEILATTWPRLEARWKAKTANSE